MSMNTALLILGLKLDDVSVESVKDSFKLRVKKLHPDVNPDPKDREKYDDLVQARDFMLSVIDGNFPMKLVPYIEPVAGELMEHFIQTATNMPTAILNEQATFQRAYDLTQQTLEKAMSEAAQAIHGLIIKVQAQERLIASTDHPIIVARMWKEMLEDNRSNIKSAQAFIENTKEKLEALKYLKIKPQFRSTPPEPTSVPVMQFLPSNTSNVQWRF